RKGSGASSATPGQPTQQPWCFSRTGESADTKPPGDSCQDLVPLGSKIMSTGSRLATTTKLLLPAAVVPVASAPVAVSLMCSKAPQGGMCWINLNYLEVFFAVVFFLAFFAVVFLVSFFAAVFLVDFFAGVFFVAFFVSFLRVVLGSASTCSAKTLR